MSVSHETRRDLETYVDHLRKWQRSINLVAPDTIDQVWSRHIEDSLQLLPLLPEPQIRIADLGSGAGLPGLVLAIARGSSAHVILVESNGKKASFLRVASQAAHVAVEIVNERIERAVPKLQAIDVVTARALAPLRQLIDWSYPLLKTGALGLFPKGRSLALELEDAAKEYELEYDLVPSTLEAGSAIVVVRSARKR